MVLIRKEDFEEIGYQFILSNLTSKVDFIDPQSIKLFEMQADRVTLLVKESMGQMGHTLMLILFPLGVVTPTKIPSDGQIAGALMTAIGKVTKAEKTERGEWLLSFQFTQYNEIAWKGIIEQFKKRQESLEVLFRKVSE